MYPRHSCLRYQTIWRNATVQSVQKGLIFTDQSRRTACVYLSCSSCSASSFSSSSSRAHNSSSVRMPFPPPPSLPSSSSSLRSSTASSLGLEFGLCAILRFPFEGDKWKWAQCAAKRPSFQFLFSRAKEQCDGAEKLSEVPLVTTASLFSTSLISTKSPFIWRKKRTKRPRFSLTQHSDWDNSRWQNSQLPCSPFSSQTRLLQQSFSWCWTGHRVPSSHLQETGAVVKYCMQIQTKICPTLVNYFRHIQPLKS